MMWSISYIFPVPNIYILALCLPILCFYSISTILLFYPRVLHPIRPKNGVIIRNKINIIGHRGSRLDGWPENTIAAFKDSCLHSGADTIELDVWLTNDGEVVIHHDKILHGTSKSITETNYEDLPLISDLDKCDKIKSSKTDSLSFEWRKIPTLKQVFENIPSHVHIIIEFKQNSDDLIFKVHQLITEFQRQDTVIWFSLVSVDELYIIKNIHSTHFSSSIDFMYHVNFKRMKKSIKNFTNSIPLYIP